MNKKTLWKEVEREMKRETGKGKVVNDITTRFLMYENGGLRYGRQRVVVEDDALYEIGIKFV